MNKLLLTIGSLVLMCSCGSPYVMDEMQAGKPGFLSAKEIDKAVHKRHEVNSKEMRLELIPLNEEEQKKLIESTSNQAARDRLKYIPLMKFNLENIEPDEKFCVYMKLLNNKVSMVMSNVDQDKVNGAIVHLGDFMFGEPIIYAIVSLHTNSVSAIEIVPFPIEAALEGRTVTIQMVDPERTIFAIHWNGFSPGENVTLTSQSMGEVLTSSVVVPANGEIVSMSMPGVIGYAGGKCSLKTESAHMKNPLEVEYTWGRLGLISARKILEKMEAEALDTKQ